MKVALVSLNQMWEDKNTNKKLVLYSLERLNERKYSVDWIIFPEMTLTGFTMNRDAIKEDLSESETISFFKECAKKYNVVISFGVVISDDLKATNNLITINSEGNILGNYAKIHPFSYANEDEYYNSGKEIVSFDFKDYRVGLTICYDLRFPELYQELSKSCDVIVNIANWPKRRVQHWNTLLKARAIENQCFMIGVNRIGVDGNGMEYEFSSTIISPNGDQLDSIQVSDEIQIFKIDLNELLSYRKSFPVKNDRKLNLYRTWYEDIER